MKLSTTKNTRIRSLLRRSPRIRHIGILAASALLLGACASAGAESVAPEADEMSEQASEPEPDPTPTEEERPGLQEATDDSVTFAIWNPACNPVASDADGTPIEGSGRSCLVRAAVTNDRAEAVTLAGAHLVAVGMNGEEYSANSDSRLLWGPIEPGETVEADLGWFPVSFDVEIVELRFAASEDSPGVTFEFVDSMFDE